MERPSAPHAPQDCQHGATQQGPPTPRGAPQREQQGALCENLLEQVMSWLSIPDLKGGAAPVCKRGRRASQSREVWRR